MKIDKKVPKLSSLNKVWPQLVAVPIRVKIVVVLGVLYLLNPIDLIPDFIPVLGQLDDIIVIAFVTKYIKKHVPNFEL